MNCQMLESACSIRGIDKNVSFFDLMDFSDFEIIPIVSIVGSYDVPLFGTCMQGLHRPWMFVGNVVDIYAWLESGANPGSCELDRTHCGFSSSA
jgi:hypothetical protein